MRRITTRDDLNTVIATASPLYVRVSRGPDADRRAGRSRNHQTGQVEAGLSVNRVTSWRSVTEYVYLLIGQPQARVWLLTGEECGRGSDGEPLLRPGSWQPVAEIDRALVDALVAEAVREDTLAEARRESWRYRDGEVFEIWGRRYRRLGRWEVEEVPV